MTKYNCPNCGAPINAWQCPYCGTVIHDFVNMDFEGHTPTYLRMMLGKRSVVMKAIPVELTTESVLYADNIPYLYCTPSAKITAEFEIVPDDEGILWKSRLKDEE